MTGSAPLSGEHFLPVAESIAGRGGRLKKFREPLSKKFEDPRRGRKLRRKQVYALVLLASANVRAEENWPMYGGNLLHTFSNPASRINPGNVANLKPLWTFSTTDAISASPTVVDGRVPGPLCLRSGRAAL